MLFRSVTAANVPDGGSVQYRVKGAADWTDAVLVEGSKYRLAPVYETSKNAAGLDVHTIKAGTGVFAATTYEVRIAKDGQAVDSKEFATAVGDKIPNGDMSGWSKRIWIDGSNNEFPITYPNPEGMKVGKPSYNVFINLQMAFFHNPFMTHHLNQIHIPLSEFRFLLFR